jgi:Ca-activated chloride channel homolog
MDYELDESKYLYLLAVIPLLVLLFLINLWWKKRKQRQFGNPELVKRLAPQRSVFKQSLKLGALCLALAGIVLALVNPKTGTRTEKVKREGIDIVFAIDVSRSMLAEDTAPSRLEKAKQIVSQIINSLGSDRVGIVGYAGSAYPVLPITTDYAVAKMFLQNMNTEMVSSQGTAIGDAIALSETFFDDPQTSKLVILVSDGEDHGQDSQDAADAAKKKGIKLITVGVGTTKGGPIPLRENGRITGYKKDQNGETVVTKLYPDALKILADRTGGGYIYGGSTRAVTDYVSKSLGKAKKKEFETKDITLYESQFQWFLGGALLLLFLDIFLLERKTGWITRLNLFNEKEQ